MLKVGIVGLPNVGKSTLFNALLKKQLAYAANYPFATIEPNIGVVEVPDDRLEKLADSIASLQNDVRPPIVHATVEFFDIAGLVRGAHKGEGLGNQFLSHIREVSVIVHVVRLFEDDNIIRVASAVNGPIDDKKDKFAWDTFQKVKKELNNGILVKNQVLSEDETEVVKPLNLLTIKPQIFVFNISENQLTNKQETEQKIQKILSDANKKDEYIYLCVKLENDILTLPENDQIEYLTSFGLTQTGMDQLIKTAYKTLNLISYLTAGEKEARAWTITKGTDAQNAAGVIHSDFIKKFIRADIVNFKDFVEANGWVKARENGKVQSVGRDYIMKDGEVADFKIAP